MSLDNLRRVYKPFLIDQKFVQTKIVQFDEIIIQNAGHNYYVEAYQPFFLKNLLIYCAECQFK